MNDFEDVYGDKATERVVAAAREELLRRGFDGASISAIAARAGLSKTTIYERFASKSDLFASVLRLTIGEAGGRSMPDVRDQDLVEALTTVGQWINRSAREPVNLALYRANIVGASRYPELAEELHGLRNQSSALIAFMNELPVAHDLSGQQLTSWFGVLTMGGLHHLLNLPVNPALDQARINGAVHLFAHGWLTPVEASPPPAMPAPPAPRISGETGRTPQARWDALLRCTADSLLAYGARGTGIDRVSAASGLSKMTIYRRFGDKDQLIAAALLHLADQLAPNLDGAASDGDLVTQLNAIARAYHLHFARSEHIALLRLMVGEAPARPALVAQLWHRLTANSHRHLSDILQKRVASGELHLTDPAIAAEQFLLLCAGGNRLLTGARSWEPSQADAYAHQLVAFCLRAG